MYSSQPQRNNIAHKILNNVFQQQRQRQIIVTTAASSSSVLFQTTTTMSSEQQTNNETTSNNDAVAVEHHKLPTTTTTTSIQSGTVTILHQGPYHVVVVKPPSVICHHSAWSGSKSRHHHHHHPQQQLEPEVPMLQRVRQVVGQRVNLIHRLDRGASGCLLLAIPPSLSSITTTATTTTTTHDNRMPDMESSNDNNNNDEDDKVTAQLIEAHRQGQKTYLALVRGEGVLHGQDLTQQGWFDVDRAIKDDSGQSRDAVTQFRFVAGQHNQQGQRPEVARASLVLARPRTGRWHQIRKHLNGLSHPILGDATHGNGPTNREWKEQRGLPPERICLHLLQLQLPPIHMDKDGNSNDDNEGSVLPNGLNVTCPVPRDLWNILEQQLPDVLRQAQRILEEEEGIVLQPLIEGADNNPLFPQVPYQVEQTFRKNKRKK